MGMTISQVRALPVGNALQVFLQPPATAVFWRVLRKSTDNFTGYDDPGAIVVFDGEDLSFVDTKAVINSIAYWYRAFYWTGAAWVASESVAGTAARTYTDASVDPMTILRDRLEAALITEVQAGVLQHEAGGIPVLLAPPLWQDTRWPVVSIHLENDASGTRFLGEMLAPDLVSLDDGGQWVESEGWMSNVSLTVIGWDLNPDGRSLLRQAIRRAIVANLAVLDSFGIVQVEWSQRDMEDFESYAAPVYQTMGTFTCQAPVLVTDSVDPVIDVSVTGTSL